MAWWRRNGSRKRARKGVNGTNGATAATRITGDDVLELVARAPHPTATRIAAGERGPEREAEGGMVATVAAPPAPAPLPAPAPAPAPPPPPTPAPAPPPPPEPDATPAPATPPEAPGPPIPAPTATHAPAAARSALVPLSALRRHTGRHMARSRATAAHAFSLVEVDLDRVERVRRAAGLDVLPFVARAVVDALARFPHLNASVDGDDLRVHRDVHLALTVDLEHQGLVAPVVRAADGKRLRALAVAADDLQARARAHHLAPDDLLGATFTINEPESRAALLSVPIIHQPQVAILATGGVQRRPVVVPVPDGGDAITVHPVALLALSWDHRAIDGAYASAFLASVRETLETRDWDAEL